jgi:hypothetical protein
MSPTHFWGPVRGGVEPYQTMFFPGGDFSGLRLSAMFPSPPGNVEKSRINRKTATVVVHAPTPEYEFV